MSTNSKTEINKFGIVVIESLKEGELQTGTKLYNDVLRPRCAAEESMFCEYYRVHSVSDFNNTFFTIIQKHQDNEMLALHIEAHGCEEGVGLSSGGLITWKHFLDCCRALNVELCGLLIVTTALCYSISIMGAIDPSLRAPFKAIVITRRPVTADEVLRGYSEYFGTYTNILDIGPAKEAMRREVNSGTPDTSPFEMITSNWLFDQITNPDRDPEAFQHIVNQQYCIKKAVYPTYTRDRVEKEIRLLFQALQERKDYFTFKDIHHC